MFGSNVAESASDLRGRCSGLNLRCSFPSLRGARVRDSAREPAEFSATRVRVEGISFGQVFILISKTKQNRRFKLESRLHLDEFCPQLGDFK